MLLLVDYSSLLYRAWHSMPDSVASRGVYGILGMLARLVQDRRPRGLGICVDDGRLRFDMPIARALVCRDRQLSGSPELAGHVGEWFHWATVMAPTG